jgi:O-antigen ligase
VLRPGWPLAALLCLYPVWWLLGVGEFAFILFAIPMVTHLLRHRPIRIPPAFGIWLLFLAWNVLCLVMLPFAAPETTAGSTLGRTISIVLRLIEFGAVTIMALYVINLSERTVSQDRIMRWLSILFLVTVAGGFFGLIAPHFEFTSPVERVLPTSFTTNVYVHALVHPQAAQVQNVLGYSSPRPAAPWGYTNYWGNNISILMVFFAIYLWHAASTRRRIALMIILALALVPIVYSLNRGLWLGLILCVLFVICSMAARGNMRGVAAAVILVPIAAIAFVLTPLHNVVSQRASHGGSNEVRTFLDAQAIKGALDSPILGWGGNRKSIGSGQSIAIGPSQQCPNCGGQGIGSTGEFFQIIFSEGFVGIGLYFGFFLATVWRLRRDRSSVAAGARLVCLLAVFFSFFYNSLPAATGLTMLVIGLAWRPHLAAKPDEQPHELHEQVDSARANSLVGAVG